MAHADNDSGNFDSTPTKQELGGKAKFAFNAVPTTLRDDHHLLFHLENLKWERPSR
jgi:hypothetical protein